VTDSLGPEPLSPSEERLLVLMAALGTERAAASGSLEARVMSTARWQYLLRGALVVIGDLVALVVEGTLLMLGVRRPLAEGGHAT